MRPRPVSWAPQAGVAAWAFPEDGELGGAAPAAGGSGSGADPGAAAEGEAEGE